MDDYTIAQELYRGTRSHLDKAFGQMQVLRHIERETYYSPIKYVEFTP